MLLNCREIFVTLLTGRLNFIYPGTSGNALKNFNCKDFGNGDDLLTSDLSVECPLANKASYLFLAAASFSGIYIFGIPIFFYLCLKLFGVPAMAMEKTTTAAVQAMLNMYKNNTSTAETEVLAKALISQGMILDIEGKLSSSASRRDQRRFLRRVAALFEQMLPAKGRNSQLHQAELSLLVIEEYLRKIGMIDTDKNILRTILSKYDKDENGMLSLEEFTQMMQDLVKRVSLFTGFETITNMTATQLKVLYRYDFLDNSSEREQADDWRTTDPETIDDLDNVTENELRDMVSAKARNLLRRGIITVPCLTWDGALGEREQRASDALGFLFQV